MKKNYFMVVAAFFCLFVTACHYDGDTTVINTTAVTPTFNVIVENLTAKDLEVIGTGKTINVGFRAGKEDIPYVCLDSAILQTYLVQSDGNRYSISDINALTTQVTITNTERNTKAVLDLTKHTLSFENYDLFFQAPSGVYMDPTGCEAIARATGESKSYIEIDSTKTSSIAGQPVTLGWYTQDVGVVLWAKSDGSCALALPLQMFNDVFLSPSGDHLLYNGKAIFKRETLPIAAVKEEYYNSPYLGQPRSEAMAELCYNELCLNLDFNYGLKAIHGIDKFPDFDTYFTSVGIKDALKSTNATSYANALRDVCEFYFGDGHSNYMYNSPYLGASNRPTGNRSYSQQIKYSAESKKYQTARDRVYGSNIPGLDISTAIGKKTAIVRFDEFTMNVQNVQNLSRAGRKAYGDELISQNILRTKYVNYEDAGKTQHSYESTYDTVAFIYAVNRYIKEYDAANPGGEIENIVLDMSCNGGGANHAACFVIAWMLGSCTFDFTNPITGAKWTISYNVDVNMNGTAGEDADTVKEKNLFCLISPVSFSCGNMVPAMLKASDSVTILGVTSSGGSSCVQNSSAADGTTFRMSSKNVMSINKNGSNYDIDKGVEPHYYINDPANFYNIGTIDALVKNINAGTLNVSVNP